MKPKAIVSIPELPPTAFSNALNELGITIDYQNWRQSKEWKLFVRGYNAAVNAANDAVKERFNFGQTTERLFGPTKTQ